MACPVDEMMISGVTNKTTGSAQPSVAFSYAKHLWSAGVMIQALAQQSGLVVSVDEADAEYGYYHLTASCYLRLVHTASRW